MLHFSHPARRSIVTAPDDRRLLFRSRIVPLAGLICLTPILKDTSSV